MKLRRARRHGLTASHGRRDMLREDDTSSAMPITIGRRWSAGALIVFVITHLMMPNYDHFSARRCRVKIIAPANDRLHMKYNFEFRISDETIKQGIITMRANAAFADTGAPTVVYYKLTLVLHSLRGWKPAARIKHQRLHFYRLINGAPKKSSCAVAPACCLKISFPMIEYRIRPTSRRGFACSPSMTYGGVCH